MYHRGHRADYDDWVAHGAEGWSWDELQPYMDMIENNKQIGTVVDGKYHSDAGVMPIQQVILYKNIYLYLLYAAGVTSWPYVSVFKSASTKNILNSRIKEATINSLSQWKTLSAEEYRHVVRSVLSIDTYSKRLMLFSLGYFLYCVVTFRPL